MNIDLKCGDCLELMRELDAGSIDAVITDPPYPNGEGHFSEQVEHAREVLRQTYAPIVMVFWSELERPPVDMPLVAVHIWHRTNVNGKIYEPIYHFAMDGIKRRSEVWRQAAVFNGVGAGCWEYAGHPTQKPIAIMQRCIQKVKKDNPTIFDPFMGSGTTGVACVKLNRNFIGFEIDENYFAIASRRIQEAQLQMPMELEL